MLNIKSIPSKSGVYLFKGEDGEILYIGKAVNLKSRVRSYWSSRNLSTRINQLVSKTKDIETIIVESELEALILEANLIKKYLPSFNIRLTDDKDYLYIKVTKEAFPQITTARKKDLKIVYKFFGPFPSSRTVKETLKKIRKIFPWCSNPSKLEYQKLGIGNQYGRKGFLNSYTRSGTIVKTRLKPCFYYHLGLCPGACVGKISQKDYKKNINRFIKFMEGDKKKLLKELQQEMRSEVKKLNFEEAERINKMILGVNYLTQPNRVKEYLANSNFLEEETKKALLEVQRALKLGSIPDRIEGYDISNISGKQATGSMVVLTNGEIDKSQYRRFKIRISGKPNDVGMHREMMQRRLNHPEWKFPELMLIDGGIGQVRGVCQELMKKNLNIPIFGLAKRQEWLYDPDGNIVKLPKRSLALKLLQKLRDEAHRFAISYHRHLRKKTYEIFV